MRHHTRLARLAAGTALLWVLSTTAQAATLLDQFRAGPMAGVNDIVFAARKLNETDGHWYANLGYYAHDANRKAWREGGKLYRWNLATGKLTTLLDDPRGGVRDPQVHYDGQKILFSYRKGGTEQYHLYEINADGTGLRQLTDGAYDDIEPTYLPDGDIVFVSTRCKRWVNCWLTQVAILYRCDADGQNIRPISSNNEQDNTPWPLPDGRLLYTRWEYVDRSQVHYHHLWAANPDGTAQMTWYGNLHPGIVMIDAKPIPGSDKVVASFSPGHGQREHAGRDHHRGPQRRPGRPILRPPRQPRQPVPRPVGVLGELLHGRARAVARRHGRHRRAAGDLQAARGRPPGRHATARAPPAHRRAPASASSPTASTPATATGRLVLADIYNGRNMAGVKRGEIKKLLVLETLPMPIHYTGGMEPISYGGTFTLERIVGTVPVEEDGSAYFELPALRSFFFVALDENDLSVKRMQSFLTVQPGETTSCVGCHEQRTQTPRPAAMQLAALRRPPSRIEPIADVPEVIDYPRDIQPMLDALCVSCHGYEKTAAGGPRAGRLILTGDHGPLYSHSYYMLTIARLFSDGRNQPRSNYAPRTLGSSASRLLTLLDGTHYGVQATPHQKKLLRLWIESGAAYPGTYAALGCGMIGNYAENQHDQHRPGLARHPGRRRGDPEALRRLPRRTRAAPAAQAWPTSAASPSGSPASTTRACSPAATSSSTSPAPSSRSSCLRRWPSLPAAGASAATRRPTNAATVFADTADPGYQALLALCVAGKESLAQGTRRFDMAGFEPRADWVREMKRYGILPAALNPATPMDCYAVERQYWESLWYRPIASSH